MKTIKWERYSINWFFIGFGLGAILMVLGLTFNSPYFVNDKELQKPILLTISFDASGYYDNYTNLSVKDIVVQAEVDIPNDALNDFLNRLSEKPKPDKKETGEAKG